MAMVTILKNMTNILTAIGELYIFRKHQNQKVWTAMFFMASELNYFHSSQAMKLYLEIISAFTGDVMDLSFDRVGNAWQIANCSHSKLFSHLVRLCLEAEY